MYLAARKSNLNARVATVIALAATKEEVFDALDVLEDAGEDVGALIELGELGIRMVALDDAPVTIGTVVGVR